MKFYCNKVIGFTKKAVRLSIGGGYIKIAYYDYIGNIDIAGNWIFYGDNDGLVYGKNRRKSKKRATRLIRDRICTFNAKEAITKTYRHYYGRKRKVGEKEIYAEKFWTQSGSSNSQQTS